MIDYKRFHRLHPEFCGVMNGEMPESYVVFFKRFDNETGKELPVEPHYTNLEVLKQDKQNLMIQLEALETILTEISKL